MAHVWVQRGNARVSTLDLLGPALTLLIDPDATAWRAAALALDVPLPVEVQQLDAMSARALGIQGGSALLARPDGVPLGVWPAASHPLPALQAAVRAASGRAALRDVA